MQFSKNKTSQCKTRLHQNKVESMNYSGHSGKSQIAVLIIPDINFMQSSTKMILKLLCIFYSNFAHSSILLPYALNKMTDAIHINLCKTNGRIIRRNDADIRDNLFYKLVWKSFKKCHLQFHLLLSLLILSRLIQKCSCFTL